MTNLISDAEEPLNIPSLAMTDLSESLMISLTIARPKLPVDVVEMSACNNYRLICEILGFLIQTPFVGRLVDEEYPVHLFFAESFP